MGSTALRGLALAPVQRRQPGPGVLGHVGVVQDAAQGAGHVVATGRAAGRHERPPLGVVLAQDQRGAGGAVQRLLELGLEEGQLVLDHQHRLHAGGQAADLGGLQRPRHADLHQAQAQRLALALAQAQVVEGAEHAGPGQPGSDDRGPRTAGLEGDPVQPSQTGVVAGALEARRHQVVLGHEVGGRQQHRGLEPLARGELGDQRARQAHVDGGSGVGDVGHDLHARPQPRVAGQRDGVQAVGQQLLDRGRGQHRHQQAAAHGLARAGHRRGLGRRIVADQRHRPARRGGPAEIAVAHRVRRPVEAGVLAVPEAGHSIVAPARQLPQELGARHRGRGQLLVETGLEHHAGGLRVLGGAAQLVVEPAERRTLVAADEHPGVQPACRVEPPLVEHQPHERLDAGHDHGAVSAV